MALWFVFVSSRRLRGQAHEHQNVLLHTWGLLYTDCTSKRKEKTHGYSAWGESRPKEV